MNSEEIIKARKRYSELKKENDNSIELLNKLEELEKDSKVASYIEFLDSNGLKITGKPTICNNSQLVFSSFDYIACKTKHSNEIWVYIGEYDNSENLGPVNCRLYRDLETGKEKIVEPLYIEDFEKRNKVINPSCSNKIEFYEELREKLFLELISKSQEEAVQKILKNNN